MDLFDRFLQERTYLKNVSPETLRYYRWVHRAFQPILAEPTKAGMLDCIQKLLADGVSPISVNTYLRGFKAYLRWLRAEGHLQDGFKVQFLRTEGKVLLTLNADQIKRLLAFKPKGRNQTRAYTVALLILDGGYRISEVLGLAFEHCDFENLLVKVRGKGNKHRLVPLSMEMRKVLYRYAVKHSAPGRLLFGTRNNTQVTVRNFGRDFLAHFAGPNPSKTALRRACGSNSRVRVAPIPACGQRWGARSRVFDRCTVARLRMGIEVA